MKLSFLTGTLLLVLPVFLSRSADSADAIAWPKFPAPSEVLTQTEEGDFAARVLQQTASGLAANRARKSPFASPYVWIEPAHHADYSRWLQAWKVRTNIPVHAVDGGVWALVRDLQARHLLSGYVLYRAAHPGAAYSTTLPGDFSVNLATSLCGPLDAVAVEEKQQFQAEALGLRQLADARTLTYDTLLSEYDPQLNPRLVSSLDPRSAVARDMAVACDAPVVINCPHGGLPEVLRRAKPGGFLFGWGLEGEDQCVRDASRAGLEVLASNWSYNLPLLASDPVALVPQASPAPLPLDASADQPGTRYLAFIESDGDNITWTMGNFASEKNFFANPARGTLPFGWSMTVSTLGEFGSDAWNYYVHAATPNDDFVHIGLTGYGFLDDTPPADITRQATLLNPSLERANIHCMIAFTDKHWDSPASRNAYQNIVDHCPALHAILPLQYMPYAAGQGVLLWCHRDGKRVPILPPRTDIWKIDDQGDFAAPPDHVATVLNRWASEPQKDFSDTYAWVIVHAWSDFGHGVVGVSAAKACAAQLAPNIRVVKPSELVERLYRAANPE